MFIKRKTKSVMLALSLTSLLVSACGGSSPSADPEPSIGSTVAGTDYNATAELNFFGNSAQSQEYFDLYYGNPIRAKFPNYKLNYLRIDPANKGTTLPELIAAGTPIDILYATTGNFESMLTSYDLQVEMTNLIKEYQIDTSRIEPTLMDALKVHTNGQVYGLPVQNNVEALYYNKTIFDKFGVPYPKDGMTWDEAAELSKKLTRFDDKQYYGFGITMGHILRTNQLSLPRVDKATEKPNINSDPKWKTVFDTYFTNMMPGNEYQQRFNVNTSLDGINNFIKDQDVAMLAFFAQLYLTNPEELKLMNWDMVSLPTFKELPGVGSQFYPMLFGLTKLTKNQEAAMNVIKFLVSDEFQLGLAKKGWMSVLTTEQVRKEYAQETPFKDKHYQALFANKPAPIAYAPIYDPNLIVNYTSAAYSIIKKTADVNTAFRTAEEAGQKSIDAAKLSRK